MTASRGRAKAFMAIETRILIADDDRNMENLARLEELCVTGWTSCTVAFGDNSASTTRPV